MRTASLFGFGTQIFTLGVFFVVLFGTFYLITCVFASCFNSAQQLLRSPKNEMHGDTALTFVAVGTSIVFLGSAICQWLTLNKCLAAL